MASGRILDAELLLLVGCTKKEVQEAPHKTETAATVADLAGHVTALKVVGTSGVELDLWSDREAPICPKLGDDIKFTVNDSPMNIELRGGLVKDPSAPSNQPNNTRCSSMKVVAPVAPAG